MTLQELARRAPFIVAVTILGGAAIGCMGLAVTVAYLTKPPSLPDQSSASGA